VQGKLRQGQPLKAIARTVGYHSPAALTRAFTRRFGRSPREFTGLGYDHADNQKREE
jgi:AraC-like DNA-binding protein